MQLLPVAMVVARAPRFLPAFGLSPVAAKREERRRKGRRGRRKKGSCWCHEGTTARKNAGEAGSARWEEREDEQLKRKLEGDKAV